MHNSFCNPKLLPLPFQSRWRLSFQYRCHCTYHIVLWGHLRLLDYFPSPTVNTPLLGIHATLNLCILFHILFIYLKQNQIIMYSMTISCYSQVVHSMSQSMILITKLAIELSVFKLDWDEARENLQEVTYLRTAAESLTRVLSQRYPHSSRGKQLTTNYYAHITICSDMAKNK